MTTPLCSCSASTVDGTTVVTLAGEIDLSNAAEIETQIVEIARAAASPGVVVDIADVEYLDSAAFAAFERLARAVPARLVVPPESLVYRAVEVAGLHAVLPIFATVDAARA